MVVLFIAQNIVSQSSYLNNFNFCNTCSFVEIKKYVRVRL